MTSVIFDSSKCVKCGACAAVCPVGVIIGNGGHEAPFIPSENIERCVKCGHCEAVCPNAAVYVKDTGLSGSNDRKPAQPLTADQLGYYMKNRRSIRNYRREPVEKQVIEKLLDIVRYAPSGLNRQPLNWIIVQDQRKVKELCSMTIEWMRVAVRNANPLASALGFERLVAAWDAGSDLIARGAPHLAIAYCHKDSRVAPTDATIALSWLELAAPSLGLGSCWAGYYNVVASQFPELHKAEGVPQDHVHLGAMMLGYPEFKYKRLPKRKNISIIWK